jgi:dihydropteroate synthase
VRLQLRDSAFEIARGRPVLMGIVNATPDSFSDGQGNKATSALVERASLLVEAGAAIVDVGGESGRTDRAAVSEHEEAARVVPVIERLVEAGVPVSVDTWRRGPARAALDAGAAMVNDVSGLAEPAIAELCAAAGAALVITHTRTPPKTKAFPPYGDVVRDVVGLLRERAASARGLGVGDDRLVLDPGIDLAKTPAQSAELLRRVSELDGLGRPLLLAISRKDFVGALTGRAPRDRGAGTLGAVEPALDAAGAILRVHDVAATADFLAVRAALRGESEPPAGALADDLRREALA